MSDRLFVATRKGLFIVERSAAGWKIAQKAFLGDNVTLTLPLADGTVFAALDHGHFGVKLHRSSDGGANWEECGCPTYPPKPEGVEDRGPMQQEIPWRLIRIWSLEAGLIGDQRMLWCGTLPGGLFRSGDCGQSWHLVHTLWDHPQRKEWLGGGAEYPGIHSICIDPTDGRRLALGVSSGGVWMSDDAGETWACRAHGMWAAYMPPERREDPVIQDVHRLVQCPGDLNWLWAQHHNGVFRSTDRSASWQEVKDVPPSTFGFAVAVHPRDPRTAWFVPAIKDERRIPVDGQVVVTRTRDGGKTFDVLRNGLPQEDAYDLAFRHALDIDETGDRLALGSTTGSLWITEDQGDRWQTVSEHLPPVYAVRFAP